ncbi:NADP-specific glutamate dehydrogenase, partial [Burkholderia sp. SIMBA_045]
MMDDQDDSLDGKRCLISGSGNVAIHAMEKLYDLGAKPLSCSDSSGTIYHDSGIDLDLVKR